MNGKSDGLKSDFAKVDATPGVPDDELPEITDEMLDRAVFSVGGIVLPTPRRRGRPPGSGRKVSTTVRLDADVIAHFKAQGPGWQTRINEALRKAMRKRGAKS
jgi:uncharacterized protein (DUF4415 family)